MSAIDEKFADKKTVYYGALVTAWFNHRMEHGKQTFNISTLGIGWLMVYYGENLNSNFETTIWTIANLAFLNTILLRLAMFHISSDHLVELIRNENDNESENGNETEKEKRLEKKLRTLRYISNFTFGSAVILTVSLALIQVYFPPPIISF